MSTDGWSKVASLFDGPRAVGGHIRIESGRLLFVPHAIDRATAGRSLDVPLSSVSRVSLTPRSWFAPRRHLLVETTDGVQARFLINGASEAVRTVAEAAHAAGSDVVASE